MKKGILNNGGVPQCLALLLAALCLAACPVEPEDEGGLTLHLLLNVWEENESKLDPWFRNNRRYFSLSTGEEVSDPAQIKSQAWDLGFESHDASFFVLTNSGITAENLGSGGEGAVWYTGKTDFTAVAGSDAVSSPPAEYLPYTQDITRYAMIMGAAPVKETMNIMTYLGYRERDDQDPEDVSGPYGSETNPFLAERVGSGGMTSSYSPYRFNKMACYSLGGGMPPVCTPTKQVYIIRHGDGQTLSKFQIAEVYLEYNAAKPTEAYYAVRFIRETL
jgi:hypothetical protein